MIRIHWLRYSPVLLEFSIFVSVENIYKLFDNTTTLIIALSNIHLFCKIEKAIAKKGKQMKSCCYLNLETETKC